MCGFSQFVIDLELKVSEESFEESFRISPFCASELNNLTPVKQRHNLHTPTQLHHWQPICRHVTPDLQPNRVNMTICCWPYGRVSQWMAGQDIVLLASLTGRYILQATESFCSLLWELADISHLSAVMSAHRKIISLP